MGDSARIAHPSYSKNVMFSVFGAATDRFIKMDDNIQTPLARRNRPSRPRDSHSSTPVRPRFKFPEKAMSDGPIPLGIRVQDGRPFVGCEKDHLRGADSTKN